MVNFERNICLDRLGRIMTCGRPFESHPALVKMLDSHINDIAHPGPAEDKRVGYLDPELLPRPTANLCRKERVDAQVK